MENHKTTSQRALEKTAHGPGQLELQTVPIPQITPDQVLIRLHACGICGSDLKIEVDEHPYVPPVVMGHEFAGEIAEVGGDVDGWVVGDRVVAEQHTHACGRCRQCLTGNAFACASKRAPGYYIDGGFAEYIAMPAWLLHRIPGGLSFVEAAFSEPAAVAAHGVLDRTGIEPEDVVLVLGCGPIGLAAAKMAQAAGAACAIVTGIDRDEQVRLPRALTVTFSYSSRYTSWERALSLFERGALEPAKFITHVLPLGEWKQGFELARSGQAIKVVLEP
jgi:L-iditol 2-dehydrogenase